MSMLEEYMALKKKYDNLKYKFKKQGEKNDELTKQNQQLVSENIILQGIVCEKYEITTNVLYANIKLLRQEKRAKDATIRCNAIKNKYKENYRR